MEGQAKDKSISEVISLIIHYYKDKKYHIHIYLEYSYMIQYKHTVQFGEYISEIKVTK